MRQLYELGDHVFRTRSERFHWNLVNSVEVKGRSFSASERIGRNQHTLNRTENEGKNAMETVVNDFDYNLGELVATMIDDDGAPFWIGSIKKIMRNKDGVVSKLLLHWLELTEDSGGVFSGKYKLAQRNTKKNNKIDWTDIVPSDSVIMTFSGLTKNSHLPITVQKHLRQHSNNPDLS